MTVLLLGALVLAAASWTARRGTVRGLGPALWVVPMAFLVLGQIWVQRDRLASYQVRLLGQRFDVSGSSSDLPGRTISGDRGAADLHIPDIGARPIATLETTASGDSASAVSVVAADGSLGVVAVRRSAPLGRTGWSLLRSVPIEPDDRIVVAGSGDTLTLQFRRSRPSLLARVGVRGTRDELWVTGSGDEPPGASVEIPYPHGAGVLGLLPRRPSVFQRTYPLSDLLGAVREISGVGGLRSFLYYEAGRPRLAVLDGAVRVETSDGLREPLRAIAIWAGADRASPFTVAGLPYRDFPEPRLAPVERYGIRPVRSLRVTVGDGWLTVLGPRPEIHSIELADLPTGAGLDLTAGGQPVRQFRLSAGDATGTAADIALSRPANRFAAAAQAMLRLPDDPTAGWFELLAPSGLARWETGRPFTLGDGDRGLLLRVDGLGTSTGFLLLLAGLFALGAAALVFLDVSGGVRALALVGMGLTSLRVLTSLSAKAHFPYVDEGHQLSLWLIPALPWVLCLLSASLSRPGARLPRSVAVTPRGFSGGYMGSVPEAGSRPWVGRVLEGDRVGVVAVAVGGTLLLVLAPMLFPDGAAKAGALAFTVLVPLVAYAGRGRLSLFPAGGVAFLRGLVARAAGLAWPGAVAGLVLLGMRAALDIAGFREQVSLGGTRIGISVVYTPAALAVFALMLALHTRRVFAADAFTGRRTVARAWVDLGAFLALAYVGVSLWISDFGIVLTTVPGPLVVLAGAAVVWSRKVGPGAVLGGVVPLMLFVLIQVAPELLRPSVAENVETASRLEDWSRNELLLLERGDPDALKLIGESRSEALGVMRETMRSYSRGNWAGKGFLAGRVSPEIRATATREHLVTGLLASQWGLLGTLGLLAMLAAVLAPLVVGLPERASPGGLGPGSRSVLRWGGVLVGVGLLAAVVPSPANAVVAGALFLALSTVALAPILPLGNRAWASDLLERCWPLPEVASPGDGAMDRWMDPYGVLAMTSLISFSAAGLYMVLANYGLVLFTGKNVYLLGLDSVGDTLEALALLGMAVAGWSVSANAGAAAEEPEQAPVLSASDMKALEHRRRVG